MCLVALQQDRSAAWMRFDFLTILSFDIAVFVVDEFEDGEAFLLYGNTSPRPILRLKVLFRIGFLIRL